MLWMSFASCHLHFASFLNIDSHLNGLLKMLLEPVELRVGLVVAGLGLEQLVVGIYGAIGALLVLLKTLLFPPLLFPLLLCIVGRLGAFQRVEVVGACF